MVDAGLLSEARLCEFEFPLPHPGPVATAEARGQRHSTTYPVVIASIPKATPEPSASEGDKRADDE